MSITPKQRMLNAYRGEFSDRWPVAPEFWTYYPAKLLDIDMIQFEREIPHWQALQKTFTHYRCEGWGIASAHTANPHQVSNSSFDKVSDEEYRLTNCVRYKNCEFTTTQMFSKTEPSWQREYPVKDPEQLTAFIDMCLDPANTFDFTAANQAFNAVGQDYLLEMMMGAPFFDFIAGAMGFEKAVYLFTMADEAELLAIRDRYTEERLEFVNTACEETEFESFFITCAYSCNSLIGPEMWRKWDKPYLKAMAQKLHQKNKLLHIHFHGKSIQSLADFVEIGVDCVCPFERPPGGDIEGEEGLRQVREILGDHVTMNGNVHTVETLIRGSVQDVRKEVRQIKGVFQDVPRLIIGSGDQVGYETPEENLYAMIEEAKRI